MKYKSFYIQKDFISYMAYNSTSRKACRARSLAYIYYYIDNNIVYNY